MSHFAGEAPVCEVQAGLPEYTQSSTPGAANDFAQMRALGFNFVRLGVSWSQLEPTPGAYSSTYLDRVAQVVGWASEQGIYVLLDMHQDNYSRFTPQTAPLSIPGLLGPVQQSSAHADGAPPWALVTDGIPAVAPFGQAELNLYVEAAFNSFWLNRVPNGPDGRPLRQGEAPGPGLQDHYIGAMAAMGRRFASNSTVVGYEIMNEPLPGLSPPALFSFLDLYPFYRRVIDAMTGVRDGVSCATGQPSNPVCGYPDLGVHVNRQAFFFEPMALRNLSDSPDQLPLPFSSYAGLVYAPHAYTHTFTVDRLLLGLPPASSPYPLSYDQAYEVADLEARLMGAALVVGEYGNPVSEDDIVLRGTTTAQDTAMVGSAIYAWKGECDPGSPCGQKAWSVYAADPSPHPAQNLGLLPTRVKYLSRVVPRAIAGSPVSFSYRPDDHSFMLSAISQHPVGKGDSAGETVVFIPAVAGGMVNAAGAAVIDQVRTEPDGTRLAYVAPTSAGPYTVTVGPSG
jgi:endoglycosylceramidase